VTSPEGCTRSSITVIILSNEREGESACPRPTSGARNDVDLLRRFIPDRGKIRSRHVTGVTVRQQKQLARAIKNAREMALLPYGSRGTSRPVRGAGP
jgi:ribosomal protein S18